MSDSRRPDLAPGDQFAGFRIEAVVGSGGMGTVYRALDLALDRERALKVLTAELTRDRDFRERFQRESRLAARLEDEGVVPIYGAGEADGRLYIAMRLIRGPDLHRLVAEDGPLPLARTVAVTGAVARALDAAHDGGIVHRDVKPANILVEPWRRAERVFLTDFGVSRPDTATTSITETGQLLGTPDYISPEQIEGERAGPRSDVYALGCVVCFALTGEPPFRRETPVATLYAHAHAERPRPSLLEPDLPPAVDEIVARATAVDPAQRYPSAGELAADLAYALGHGAPVASGAGTPITPRTRRLEAPPRRRRWVAVGAALLAIAALAAIAAILLWPEDADNPAAPEAIGVSSVAMGHPVDSVVVGGVNVLVGSHADSTLQTIDPGTGEVGESPRRVAHPTAVAVGFGAVWVTSSSGDVLLRYGPSDRDTPTEIGVGSKPADVAVGEDSVWVANRDDATVTRVDPLRNEVVDTISVAPRPQRIATDGRVTWVASPTAGALTRLDAGETGTAAEVVQPGGRPADVAIAEGSLWVADPVRGTLSELSLEDGSVLRSPTVLGGAPAALAVGPGALWVADKGRDLAIRVDPAQPDSREQVEVGHRPVAIAVGAGSVWVANAGDEDVTRIVR